MMKKEKMIKHRNNKYINKLSEPKKKNIRSQWMS